MSSWHFTYRTSYSRALHSYAVNAFTARYLDADDIAFIEGIRERGSITCGTPSLWVPTVDLAWDEQLEFWRSPYAVDKYVARRHGPIFKQASPPRATGTTPEALRRKRTRADMMAALGEERRIWEAKQREKIRRDIEWEEAAPHRKIGARHYIPQWKFDDYCQGKIAKNDPVLTKYRRELERLTEQHAAAEAQRADELAVVAANADKVAAVKENCKLPDFGKYDARSYSEPCEHRRDLQLQHDIAAFLKGKSGMFGVLDICIGLNLPPEAYTLVLINCREAVKAGLIRDR